CSAMIQFRAQLLQRSPLQLFDGSLALGELPGDVANAPLFEEAQDQDAPLLLRKAVDASRKHRALLSDRNLILGDLRLLPLQLPRLRVIVIGDRIRRHSIEPRGEWLSLPFEFVQIGERPSENLRR